MQEFLNSAVIVKSLFLADGSLLFLHFEWLLTGMLTL